MPRTLTLILLLALAGVAHAQDEESLLAPEWQAMLDEAAQLAQDEAHASAIERVQREAERRTARWYELRETKKLLCKECEGERRAECADCRGGQLVPCKVCKGKGTVVTKPGRRPVRRNCSHCDADGAVACEACQEGLVDCPDCVGEGVPGFRPLAMRRAFWDFISSAARKGLDRDAFARDVLRGKELLGQVGPQLAVRRAEIQQVAVLRDRVLVIAEVVFPDVDDPVLVPTVWIQSGGKLYLQTERDEEPEPLLE